MKGRPSPQGSLHHSALSSSDNRARRCTTSRPHTQEAIKNPDLLTHPETLGWLQAKGKRAGVVGMMALGGWRWWYLFVSKNGESGGPKLAAVALYSNIQYFFRSKLRH